MAYGVRMPLEQKQALAEKFGMKAKDAIKWYQKYRILCTGAELTGKGADLSFSDYLRLARRAGITSPRDIGRHCGKYQMARKGDKGSYVIGNCRFVLAEDNQREKIENGGSLRGALATADLLRGRTKESHESVRRQADAITGRTKKTHKSIAVRSEKISAALKGRTKATDSGRAETSRKLSKSFVLVSPGGKKFKGSGMSEFCTTHSLPPGIISRVLRGLKPHHEGWTGHYV